MLLRTDPFRELDRLAEQLLGTAGRPVTMPMDAYEREGAFWVHFDLPGVDPAGIELSVEQNVLTVHAERPTPEVPESALVMTERPHGVFRRQLFLGETLDVEHIEASYEAGVLTVRIPVAEEAKSRKIEISSTEEKKEIAG
ncbi:Hsp20/alpha crystallin family protein [Streptomyces sp. NPDC000070]|uniref:Hsp20/alpha crystallin family protein n=1 Tax=Streptomyces sp. NPDC000070 TaxID=3154240 RepID=UPI003317699A